MAPSWWLSLSLQWSQFGGILAYCQIKYGAWPALDMPSFQTGGTWKFLCRTELGLCIDDQR